MPHSLVRSLVHLFVFFIFIFNLFHFQYLNFIQMFSICQFTAFFKFLLLCQKTIVAKIADNRVCFYNRNKFDAVFDVWTHYTHGNVVKGFQILDFFICIYFNVLIL